MHKPCLKLVYPNGRQVAYWTERRSLFQPVGGVGPLVTNLPSMVQTTINLENGENAEGIIEPGITRLNNARLSTYNERSWNGVKGRYFGNRAI